MKCVKATVDMAGEITNIFQTVISEVYPKYYPEQVVDFFCKHHSFEHTLQCIESGSMRALISENKIVGIGAYSENHITGLYVLTDCQQKGCGTYLLKCLEDEIFKSYEDAVLDASLSAAEFYERRGYITAGHGHIDLVDDVKLVYEIMKKSKK